MRFPGRDLRKIGHIPPESKSIVRNPIESRCAIPRTVAILLLSITLGYSIEPSIPTLKSGKYQGYCGGMPVPLVYDLQLQENGHLGGELRLDSGSQSKFSVRVEFRRTDSGWVSRWDRAKSFATVVAPMRVYQTPRGPLLSTTLQLPGEQHVRHAGFWLDRTLKRQPMLMSHIPMQIGEPISAAVTVYTSGAGLADNAVRCSLEAADGHLWFGTVNGLSRFDGQTWKTFTPENSTLPDENVTGLAEYLDGPMVVATKSNGLFLYQDGQFHPHPANGAWSRERITGLQIAGNGDLWCSVHPNRLTRISEDRTVSSWVPSDLQFPRGPGSDSPDAFVDYLILPDGRIFVSSTRGAILLDLDRPESVYVHSTAKGKLEHASDGRLFYHSYGTVCVSDDEFRSTRAFELPSECQPVHRIQTAQHENHLWIVAHRKLYQWEIDTDRLHPVEGIPQRFLDATVQDIFEDAEGGLWIVSAVHGVLRAQREWVEWLDDGKDRTPANLGRYPWQPSSIVDGPNTIHVAASSYITTIQDGKIDDHQYPGGEQATALRSIVRDGDDFWIGAASPEAGGFGTLAFLVHQRGSETEWHPIPITPGKRIDMGDIACRQGEVWVTAQASAFRFRNGSWATWQEIYDIDPVPLKTIATTSRETLWFGADESGLFLDQPDHKLRHFTTADGLPSNTISCVYEGKDQTIWIGTPSGMCRWRGTRFESVSVGPFHELNAAVIIEDAVQRLWLGTGRGIVVVAISELERYWNGEIAEPKVLRLGVAEGLENETVYTHHSSSAAAEASGHLYFCMEGGAIARINPALVPMEPTGPKLEIAAITGPGESAWSGRIAYPPAAQQFLRIDYKGIGFTRPEGTRYHYRLKGLSDEWKSVGTQRHTIFPGLNPGAYEFQLKAYNGQQTRSAAIARWPFTVRPYLHQTWWFRLALLSAVAAILYGVYRYRLRWQLHTNALEKRLEMEEERSRIARDMHDEIGSALAQIGMLGQLAEQSSDPQKTNARIRKLAKHCSQSLREIIWSLTPQHNRIEDLEAYLRHYVDQALDGSGTRPSYQFNVAANLDTELSPATRRQLLLILKGILSNVLKHAQATEFHLSVESDENQLVLKAQDNGIGFDPEQMPPDAIGLTTIRERAEQIQSSFEINSSEFRGTCLTLMLPLA